jgi:hypothetical protein
MSAFIQDPILGKVKIPSLDRLISVASRPTRRMSDGEMGIVIAKQFRPRRRDDGLVIGFDMIWHDVSANERVDAGAAFQAVQCFGGSGTPAAPSAANYARAIAVASASLTRTKTDQSLGSASAGVTTNEYTTIGLSRANATLTGGQYTLPASLGATFAQQIAYQFTASGSGTAYGSGVFNSTTPAGSVLYVEDNFSTSPVLASSDTLTITWTITN